MLPTLHSLLPASWVGSSPQIDQTSLFYTAREPGRDYVPPFSIANPTCYGTSRAVNPEAELMPFVLIGTPDIINQEMRSFYSQADKWEAKFDLFVLSSMK